MIFLALLLTCLIGWRLLPRRWEFGLPGLLSLSFGLGATAISVQMFLLDLAGADWSLPAVLGVWAAFLGWSFWRFGLLLPRPARPAGLNFAQGAAWLVIAAPAVVWLPYERLMPLTGWDAWAIWLLKAKAFYTDGSIGPLLERGGEFVSQPGYPLLVPLYTTFLYVLNGGVVDQAAKVFSPCFYLATLGVFHHFARQRLDYSRALVLTAMLASVPMLGHAAFESAGYADVTLAFYFLAAAGFLEQWFHQGGASLLAAASIAATAAAWTKNEGQFFLLAVLLWGSWNLARSRARVGNWLWLFGPPVAVLLPWWLVRQAHGVEAAGFVPGIDFQAALFATALRHLLSLAADPRVFNLTFYLFAAGVIGALILGNRKPSWTLHALVAWQFLGALLAYATGRNEIQWWLGTSADRILVQITPLALLSATVVFAEWSERYDQEHTPAAPDGTARAPARTKRRSRRTTNRS